MNHKQPIKLDEGAQERILGFFNAVEEPSEIVARILVDPDTHGHDRDGDRDGDHDRHHGHHHGISTKLAERLIDLREELPERCFSGLEQLWRVSGVDRRVRTNITFSFAALPLDDLNELATSLGLEGPVVTPPAGLASVGPMTLLGYDQAHLELATEGPWELDGGALKTKAVVLHLAASGGSSSLSAALAWSGPPLRLQLHFDRSQA